MKVAIRSCILVAILAFVAVAGSVSGSTAATLEPAPFYKIRLINVTTAYGPEDWKLDSRFYQNSPAAGAQSGAGQFKTAVGYRVDLRVKLLTEAGADVPATDTNNVVLNATIPTGHGTLLGYVYRESGYPCIPTCTPFYHIVFDTDGSNPPPAPAPGSTGSADGLLSGPQYVHIQIDIKDPSATKDAGKSDLVFTYARPTVAVSVSDQPAALAAQVPDTMFRLFTDIGWGNTVAFIHKQVPKAGIIQTTWSFGVPSTTVQLRSFEAQQVCQQPSGNCLPGGGTATIHGKLLATSRTDFLGRVTFNTTAADLLAYPTRTTAPNAALVVIAAQLAPESDIGPQVETDTYAQGSSAIYTGASEVVVPVSAAGISVTGFKTTKVTPNQNPTTDPVSSESQQTTGVTLGVYDDTQTPCGPACGDAVAIAVSSTSKGPQILTRGTIGANNPFQSGDRSGSFPAQPIQQQHVTSYRVFALLYDSSNDFNGFAFADRGYTLQVTPPNGPYTQSQNLWINITSVNTNYDTRAGETAFDLPVLVRYVVADPRTDATTSFVVAEGGTASRNIPFTVDHRADVAFKITSTGGDTLSDPLSVTGHFTEPPAKKGMAGRIPGPEFALVAALIVGAALLRRRA